MPSTLNSDAPAGVIYPFGGTVAPKGFLFCDGSAVSRSVYAALFAAIGTTWGAGDGSTTFNLPDLRGRSLVVAGQGSGLTNRDIATKFGSETHPLSQSEMPSHYHAVGPGTQTNLGYGTMGYYLSIAGVGNPYAAGGTGYAQYTDSRGSGTAHNNIQPSVAVNAIIKY